MNYEQIFQGEYGTISINIKAEVRKHNQQAFEQLALKLVNNPTFDLASHQRIKDFIFNFEIKKSDNSKEFKFNDISEKNEDAAILAFIDILKTDIDSVKVLIKNNQLPWFSYNQQQEFVKLARSYGCHYFWFDERIHNRKN